MANKRPTVYDVAEAAGVSIATVSFTFRQPERVREATRTVVLEAARALGYVPSAAARGLAHGRTGALGLYSFDLFLEPADLDGPRPAHRDPGPFFAPDDLPGRAFTDDSDAEDHRLFPLYVDEVQRGFELECARRGKALLIGSGPGGDRASVTDIASRVDGLAVFPGERAEEILAQLSRTLPVVALAMPFGAGGQSHVRVDNVSGTVELTEHLVRTHGITDIGFVGALEMPDEAERFGAMRSTLERLGLPAPTEVLDPTPIGARGALPVIHRLAAEGALPRALMCASDQHALDVLDVLRAAGLRVPQDVAVTGFDGVVAGRLTSPPLTTVRQPMEAMGRLAADLLIDSIANPGAPAVDMVLPVRVVIRQSCGCPA